MADYAAVPAQPIADAVLLIDAAGDPVLTGRGFSSVVRASANPGDFLLTMDEGVGVADIGSGQLINVPGLGFPDGRVGPNGIDPRFLRASFTMRSGTTAPGTTTLSELLATPVAGSAGTQIRVTLRNFADALTDPMGAGAPNANGGGLEIIVWYGNATPDNVSQQAVGPLYQSSFKFP